MRVPIERCRCLDEFALAPQHVRLEGLVIRQGIQREIVARGVRVLIRSRPVGDLPGEVRNPPLSWFDPEPAGEAAQRSTDLFIDQEDIAEFIRGLKRFMRIPEGWPEHTLREHEAVYAWDSRLVFRTVKRNHQSVAFLSCATDPPINISLPAERVGELIQWLGMVSAALAKAEDG